MKTPIRRFGRGCECSGQGLHLKHGLALELAYVEDSIPVFKAKPAGRRAEMWTKSEDHPNLYYRCGRWPARKKPVDFNKLINKAMSTRGLMDEAVKLLNSGRVSFQEGHA